VDVLVPVLRRIKPYSNDSLVMRKILLITYDFPPALSGVRRVVKFVKYLPESGWQPIVLTVKTARSFLHDQEPLGEITGMGVPVYRCGSLDPHRLSEKLAIWRRGERKQGGAEAKEEVSGSTLPHEARAPSAFGQRVMRFLRRWIFVPDDRVLWVPFAIKAARRIIHEHHPEVVYTTSFPNSTHLVGLRLRKRHPVKWVADFRDGWVQNPVFFDPPTALHRAFSTALERRVVRRADLIITVSDPITEHCRQLVPGLEEKCVTIPNGFDEDDFRDLKRMAHKKFTISYTGTLFGRRTPEPLLRAIAQLLQEEPEIRPRFQVLLFTRLDANMVQFIKRRQLGDVVHVCGFVPYKEALQRQVNADVLLIMIPDSANTHIMVTQKLFEYLRARRPILALVPDGVCRKVIDEARAGTCVYPSDIPGIKQAMLNFFTRWQRNELAVPPWDRLMSYSRQALTSRFAAHLNTLISLDK
jgi:glycosyltransferase involved in cell wall biosynthesis